MNDRERPAPEAGRRPSVSIIIKALNEEATIARSIESALRALDGLEGEVILADSLSTDRTVEIASRYPIRIVQLEDRRDRSCGVGAQLGYQYARHDLIYILDGDMEIDPAFLQAGILALNSDPTLGGVAGLIEELGGGNFDFERRKLPNSWAQTPGPQPWLICGGLYRPEALRSLRYLTNRNLHAYEEMELGLRLQQQGWHFTRLGVTGVRHHGETAGTLQLLQSRWRGRGVDAGGELLRASWKQPYWWQVAYHEKSLLLTIFAWIWFIGSLLLLPKTPVPLIALGVYSAVVVSALAWKKRSLRRVIEGILWWNVYAVGFLRGLFRPQIDPATPIDSRAIGAVTASERSPHAT